MPKHCVHPALPCYVAWFVIALTTYAYNTVEYMLVVAQLAFNEFKQDLDIDIVYTVVCAQDVDNPRFL